MYNSVTVEKIKRIPQIGDINTDALPQELTKIYAQIVSVRRKVADSSINLDGLREELSNLRMLANNLEIILLTQPNHTDKESIAFVAATAHSLIHKLGVSVSTDEYSPLLANTISPLISGVILFLIGNNQADAAELSRLLKLSDEMTMMESRLIRYIRALGAGRLTEITGTPLTDDLITSPDIHVRAVECLWREIGRGIYELASVLTGVETVKGNSDPFDNVIEVLADRTQPSDLPKVMFTGPYHLARLLKILRVDLLGQGVINTPTPRSVPPSEWLRFLRSIAKDRPFLWQNHKEAIEMGLLEPGVSSVLTLPTGSGKSTLSELKIASCILSGREVIYLVPTHALENQVRSRLRSLFADKPISVQDGFLNLRADDSDGIRVMTPETCQALYNQNPNILERVGLVVFDEFHLIHGSSNIVDQRALDAMHCLVSLLAGIPKADFVLISAMVANGKSISDWIEHVTKRRCLSFSSAWKPTRQLHGCLVYDKSKLTDLGSEIKLKKLKKETKGPPKSLIDRAEIAPSVLFCLRNVWETTKGSDYFLASPMVENLKLGINKHWELTANRNENAARLGAHFVRQGIKTLIFVDSPRAASSTAKSLEKLLTIPTPNPSEERSVESLHKELGSSGVSYFDPRSPVGVHHGLLLPIERELIEASFQRNDGINALVATTTLAQGMNLPAEVVIIAGDDRYDYDSDRRIKVEPHELLNAAGRAGRAGHFAQGVVLLIPGSLVSIDGSAISETWWRLKDDVFSMGDQCLNVEDPFEYLLDSIWEAKDRLTTEQSLALYRLKPDSLEANGTRSLISRSLYAFRCGQAGLVSRFQDQLDKLVIRRNELDLKGSDSNWARNLSCRFAVDPNLVHSIGNSIKEENLKHFLTLSVTELIGWLFHWMVEHPESLEQLFSRVRAKNELRVATGLKIIDDKTRTDAVQKLRALTLKYISGGTLAEIDQAITGKISKNVDAARRFVIRLIPEISYVASLFSAIITEKFKLAGLEESSLPASIEKLAQCIRLGFNSAEMLKVVNEKNSGSRVEVHNEYEEAKLMNDPLIDWLEG